MILGIHATKIVVRDLELVERFYMALGLEEVGANTGGEGNVRQKQSWLAASREAGAHMLILSQFLEVHAPAAPDYPREFWMAFHVADVDAVCATAQDAGGSVLRPGEDRPEHDVRAAVIADPEGHIIELVGPMSDAAAALANPLAKGANA